MKLIWVTIPIILLAAIGISATFLDFSQSELTNIIPYHEESSLPNTVFVGALLPLTGDRTSRGEDYTTAIRLAEQDFNNYLDEIDAKWNLSFIIEDTATSPVIALEKLAALNAKNIQIIIGPQTSAEVRSTMNYAEDNDMLLVSSASTAPSLAIPDDNVYRFVPDDSTQGHVLAHYIIDEGITNVVPIWRGDIWGDGLHDIFVKEFTELGGNVDEGVRYNPDVKDFSTSSLLLADKIQRYSDNTSLDKVAVLAMTFSEAIDIMQSSSEYDILDDVRWFGSSAIVKDNDLIKDKISGKFSEDVEFTALQFAPSKSDKYERIHSLMKAELGRVSNSYTYSTYDSVWIIGLAILQTQSTEMSVIKDVIPSIAEDYSGVIGSTKLNDAGDLINSDYELWGIENSKWVLLAKHDSATDSIIEY